MRIDPALTRRLYADAQGERWQVSTERFAAALSASVDRAFAGRPASPEEVRRYLEGLHLEDLALACACLDGSEDAWTHLLREHRPALYRAADALDSSGGAREIADSLYGELYGTSEKDGERRALLRYFHGRSSLATWLRSVLAQRIVDRVRLRAREQVLPDDESPRALPSPARPLNLSRDRYVVTMRAALGSAMAALDRRDRLRLGCYYVQELTLAETGRLLQEHEATVSRQLARTRQTLRADVERRLREEFHLTGEAIVECFATVADDAGPLDLAELIGTSGTADADGLRKKTAVARSKKEQRV